MVSYGDKLPSVKSLLGQLLDGMIDYAGLFPPAHLGLDEAFAEFCGLPEDRAWLVDLFICPSNKLAELDALVRRKGMESLAVSVIGNPIDQPDKAMASIERDLQRMEGCANLEFGAYEIKINHHDEGSIKRAIKSLDRSGIGDLVEDTYVEFAWNSTLEDCMHDLAAINPNFGAKARTGGLTADLFPSHADLAHFIHTAVSIEIPFKMTAGLHEPLRYLDTELDVYRHGFLNVALASAFALSADLSTMEVEEVLNVTDAADFEFGEDQLACLGHVLKADDVALFQDWFGGFGSCSVDEPVAGLKKLGYW